MQNLVEETEVTPAPSGSALLSEVRSLVIETLTPNLEKIDVQGVYPREFMHDLGKLGAYAQATPVSMGGVGYGLKGTITMMEEVANHCLSTGFCTWCQSVCAWYIQNGESDYLKETLLPRIIRGDILGGTGLSNPMKHFAGIEKLRLRARPTAGGYIINGTIPWVSNVGVDHYFAVVASVEDGPPGDYLMAMIAGNSRGLKLGNGGHFIALEGSSTFSCAFQEVFISHDCVLAHPCQDFISRIRPGFVLTQTGFGLGLVSSCVELMKHLNVSKSHVNRYLDDQVEDIEADLEELRAKIYGLADEIGCGEYEIRPSLIREVVQARLDTSRLSLRASQALMLHAGANGYRQNCIFERKLRESYFVAIVTPALKHLKKLLADLPVS